MAFAQLEDLSGPCEVVIFPRLYAKAGPLLSQYNEFVVIGSLDITGQQQCKIKANNLIPLATILEAGIALVQLTLKQNMPTEQIDKLQQALPAGNTPCTLLFQENGKQLQLSPRKNIRLTNETLSLISSMGVEIRLQVSVE